MQSTTVPFSLQGHSWKLVSANPMLKLAAAVAGACDGYADFSDYTWGDSWVLPSKADVQPLVDAKATFSSGVYPNYTLNFSGIGVLKYMEELNINIETETISSWLAETDGNDNRYALRLYIGGSNEIRTTPNRNELNLLYKYVGE